MVLGLAPSPGFPSSIPGRGLSVSPVYVWVLSRYSSFLPLSQKITCMSVGDSKLSLGVSVTVHSCVSRFSLCGSVMDWRPVQGVPRLSSNDSWDRLQRPARPEIGLSGYRRWIDVYVCVSSIYKKTFV